MDLAKLATVGDTQHFFDVLMALYMLSNQVALLDGSGQLLNESATEATFKVSMGGVYQYHRATLVDVVEDYGVLKVLGGNLLLAPLGQIQQ
jgi:hypothetical protein